LRELMKRKLNTVTVCIIWIVALFLLSTSDLLAREFCLSNSHGFRLSAEDTLVETTILELNKINGSVCELENIYNKSFLVTLFVHKTLKKSILGTSLDEFGESQLRMYKKTFGMDVELLDKKNVSEQAQGYLLTLRSCKMKNFIIHYATVNSGLEYTAVFTFPEQNKAKYEPLVRNTLKGLNFATPIQLIKSINTMSLAILKLDTIRIPYPKDWRVYSAQNIDELKKSEVDDHFYSELFLSNSVTHVFKSKYENEQLFTMTVYTIPKQLNLEQQYSDLRDHVNSLFQKDYGSNYLDKSLGKIVIKGRPYYSFIFETKKADDSAVMYQLFFVNKGITYILKFKSPAILFQALKPKMDEIIEKIEY
jgi:hypothetical protein